MVTKIKNKLWRMIRFYFYSERISDTPMLLNLNRNAHHDQRKALICYTPRGYFLNPSEHTGRTIYSEIFVIVKILSEWDYCVDIIGCNDVAAVEKVSVNRYDLILGFGETFFRMVNAQPHSVSVLYMTENHPAFSVQEEQKRNDYFFERHGVKVPLTRSRVYYTEQHLQPRYSQVITLSDIEPLRGQYPRPFALFPTGIQNSDYSFSEKDYLSTRKHFLWLGSHGAIHKGLDVLLDVFSSREDIVLHVCGLSDSDRRLLHHGRRVNIVHHGYIDIMSEDFLKIVETCSFITLPSCSEAFSTSVTTGMLHGLIPVVMRNAGFDRMGDAGVFLDDYRLDYLAEKFSELAIMTPEELGAMSRKAYDFAQRHFLISSFEEAFRKIFLEINP